MRFQDWPERLNILLMESHSKPFVWGEHDCCAFAARVVLALTGEDHFAPYAGYATALEAARVLKDHDGVDGIATAALGAEIPPMTAGRGDIVMVVTPDHGDTLAVCIGDRCVAPGQDSMQYLPMSAAVSAWRVI
jgi:hypothetical protein